MTTSTQASSGLDPEATIRCSDWARDAGETAEGAALGSLIGPLRYRLQAVVPADPAAGPRERRVVLHARRPGQTGFSGYRRFEAAVGESLTDTVAALIAAAASESPSGLESPAVDVLVCTHGTRDSCCGRRGASLAVKLAAAGLRAGENFWRTSHLGGHRFAPTFLVLPQAWTVPRSRPSRSRSCAGSAGACLRRSALVRSMARMRSWPGRRAGRPSPGPARSARAAPFPCLAAWSRPHPPARAKRNGPSPRCIAARALVDAEGVACHW